MKIKYKYFFSYETKALEYFLHLMMQQGYELTKLYGNFFAFSREKKDRHYCVLGSEASDLECEYSRLELLGWNLVGQNGTVAIFSNENSTAPIQIDASIPKVKKRIRNHIVQQMIFIVCAIVSLICKVIVLKRQDSSLESVMFYIFLLGTFMLFVALIYFLAEIYSIIRGGPTTGERSQLSSYLFSIGDTGVLIALVLLILISIAAILNTSLILSLYIVLLWIIWLLALMNSSTSRSDIICSLAFTAFLIYSSLVQYEYF